MRQGVLYALFFLSGCSALIYELVWQRMLNLVFGVSTLSVSAVLAAFMGGLALGGVVFGRMVDRTSRPLRFYALLEAGIGFGAILLPVIFSFLPGIYVWLHAHLHPAPWGGAVLKFALAFPVLLGLASIIGGTFPVMARLVMDRQDALSRKFSLLYAINTVGAVLGTGLTGFMLLRHFGMQETLWLAASINSFIALTAWLVELKTTGSKNLTSDVDGERNDSSSLVATPSQRHSPSSKLIFICAGLTGMASMGLEVSWARILGILTSNSAFGFALLLILLLGGFGVGSLVHALWARFHGDSWRRLAFIQWALAAVVMGSLPFLHTSPSWLDRCCDGSSVTAVFLGEFGLTALAVFVPGILMGMSLPLLVAAGAGKRITVGRWLGRIYAINTLGCVIGAFATGFLLIPWLGIQSSVGLLLGAYLVVGMAAWYNVSQLPRTWRWGGIVLALGIYVSGWQILPAEGYFKSRIEEPRQLIYYQEGNNATVTVVEEFDGVRSIMVDGQPVAGTVGTSLIDQKMLAHLPLLLHPTPHRALTVGFGSGGTSWSMILHDIDVDCVEIEQAVPGAADHFLSENHGVLSHSRFRLIVDDARSWLRVAPHHYDVIVTDCTNIQYRSNGDLYTVDYFRLMKERLGPEGLAAAWVPANGIREADLKILLQSFREVFPHTSIWYMNTLPTDFLIVVGSPGRLEIDMDKLGERMRQPRVSEDLATIGLADPCRLVHGFLLGEGNLASYLESSQLNTDDRPVLSYSTYGATFQRTIAKNLINILSSREEVARYLTHPPSTESLLRHYAASTEMIMGHVNHWNGLEREALIHYARGAEILPEDPALQRLVISSYLRLQEETVPSSSNLEHLGRPAGN